MYRLTVYWFAYSHYMNSHTLFVCHRMLTMQERFRCPYSRASVFDSKAPVWPRQYSEVLLHKLACASVVLKNKTISHCAFLFLAFN